MLRRWAMRYWPTAQSSSARPACLACSKDFGEIVGEAEAGVAAGGGFAQQAHVLGAQIDAGAGVLGRMEHHVAVGRVERRLEERAVDGFEKDGRLDALRFGKDERFAERLNHGADEEIAAELDGVGLARFACRRRRCRATAARAPGGPWRWRRRRRRRRSRGGPLRRRWDGRRPERRQNR